MACAALAGRGSGRRAGLVVASFQPSGYTRESAVTRLAGVRGPLAARALALRAGDWVPEVRDPARAALEPYLSSAGGLLAVGEFAEAFAGRTHGRWLADRVDAAVAGLGDDDLARLLRVAGRRLRRVAYRVAIAGRRLDVGRLVTAAERDDDLVIRTLCAGEALRLAAAAGDLSPVRFLADSGTAAVRSFAVSALARSGDIAVALAALPDRNPIVREAAQAAARRAGIDVAAAYRELIRTGDPGAVAGLGETGGADDAALVRPALTHPLPRGRVEAVRALRRLGAIDPDTLLALFEDPSPAVTRQVAVSLRARAADVPAAALDPLLLPANPPHVRSAACRVLRERDVWTRLRIDLQLYADADERLRGRARGDVDGWLHEEAATTYAMPAGDTAAFLDRLLADLAGELGQVRLRELRFHLGLTRTSARADGRPG